MTPEFPKINRLFDQPRVRAYLIIFACVNIASLTLLLLTSQSGVDRHGFLLGTDFLSFWTAGGMALDGTSAYDPAAHILAQRSFFTQEGSYTAFFYPPTFLLICQMLGAVPYFPALFLWLMASGLAWLAVLRLWWRADNVKLPIVLFAAAFPPVLINITHGQTAFLVAALLGGGAILVPKRPVLAGICFGLATFKPQFGILVPLVLLLTGEWRVIMSAGVTALALAAATIVAFGPDIWLDWLTVSGAAQDTMTQGAVGYGKMQSVLSAALLLGAPVPLAYGLQAAVAAAVVVSLVWAGWRREYNMALAAAMLAGALLVTPFILDYDLLLVAFPLIWLASRKCTRWEQVVAAATFALGAFARPLGVEGIPIAPLVLISFFVVLVRCAARERAQDAMRRSGHGPVHPHGSG